jgi:hypothetical protein
VTELAQHSSRTGRPGYGVALMLTVVVCGIWAFLLDSPSSAPTGLLPHLNALEQLNRCDPNAPDWTLPDFDDSATDSSADDDDDDDGDGADTAITATPLYVRDTGYVWHEHAVAANSCISVTRDNHFQRGPPSDEQDAAAAALDDDVARSRTPFNSSSPLHRRHAGFLAARDIHSSLPPASYGHSLRAPPH